MNSKCFAVSNCKFVFATVVVIIWTWAVYRYSMASFIPVPEQGIVVEIRSKWGTRYVSELDRLAFYIGLIGIVSLALIGVLGRFLRRK